MTSKDLIVDHFTLARHHPIEDRFRIIAESGVRGIGLYLGDVQKLLAEGLTLDRLGELLDEYDLVLADLEAVRAFTDDPAARAQVEGFLELAWQLADRFGARYLQAVGPAGTDRPAAVERFADLCDRAGAHGLLVGLEPLPFTDLRTAAEAMEIVDLAARPNGGLCLDIWHHTRGGEGRAALAEIDPTKVFCIQMSDGPLLPLIDDYREDCLRTRVGPGEGEMDALGFVRAVLALGVDVPWSLEVCNESAWEAPGAQEHVQRCVAAMRDLLAAAHAPD